ncbi:MAG: 3-phosphoserine/phosphohydroxythreonine transaminase [Gammaproteobacteria bacterium]|nr:3-phosphoserine/phosphohydroxythreonine transaminase [Gammaproteobacteria bacterium]
MMRNYNFCSGPAALPEPVLRQAQEELLDWRGMGASVMEVSHRSAEFDAVAKQAEADLRELMAIPANYKVLFLHGGASHQFGMVPLNLLGGAKTSCDILDTGIWSEKAVAEAKRYGGVNTVKALVQRDGLFAISEPASWKLDSNAAYVHYTPNETIGGVEYHFIPETGGVPLVADMSSNILSRPIDIEKFGLIYAGAQKNIGPSGLTVVVVREDLLDQALPFIPSMYRYKTHAEHGSLVNTAPTFAWYLAGLVFQWLKAEGGVAALGERNARKAQKLYDYIDASGFYSNPIHPSCRSRMNIPFRLADESLNKAFLVESEAAGLMALAGHRSVGGMRASIYNAMPEAGVDALIDFMREFARVNG